MEGVYAKLPFWALGTVHGGLGELGGRGFAQG